MFPGRPAVGGVNSRSNVCRTLLFWTSLGPNRSLCRAKRIILLVPVGTLSLVFSTPCESQSLRRFTKGRNMPLSQSDAPATKKIVMPHRRDHIIKQARERIARIRASFDAMDYLCSGTLLRRMKMCGKPGCRCAEDPDARHGPYYEWGHLNGCSRCR